MIPVVDRPLFTGLVEHSLDDKGRLVVPSRFRALLGSSFFLTILHPDGCLALYPAAQFQKLCSKLEDAAVRDDRFRTFQRYLFAHTDEASCDEQGRIMIPPTLRSWADVKKNVVSIGAMSRVEVWAKERYDRHIAERGELGDFTSELGLS